MKEKVLCVDDDQNILSGYQRQLRKQFDLSIAAGGEQGLEIIASEGPFAVVVSDMRMPGMDGIAFLGKVRETNPDAVRMMLTGNADVQSAINAVNEGNVFRFLTKPCSSEQMANALNAGVEQYRLLIAERELLQDTLTGCMKVLTDIISLFNPSAFGRASRVRRYVKHIAQQLELNDVWEFEMAAMLSQIGCVTLPQSILKKVHSQDILTSDEQKMVANHPAAGKSLLENIPRLQNIAQMVARQREPYWTFEASEQTEPDKITLGAHILKVALDLDELLEHGVPFQSAWKKMSVRVGENNPQVLEALMGLHMTQEKEDTRQLSVEELQLGMVTTEQVCCGHGSVIVPAGQEITYPVLQLLRNVHDRRGVIEPIYVRMGGCIVEKVAALTEGAIHDITAADDDPIQDTSSSDEDTEESQGDTEAATQSDESTEKQTVEAGTGKS